MKILDKLPGNIKNRNITFISLAFSDINEIQTDILAFLLEKLNWLDMRNNRLSKISKLFSKETSLQKLWLGGNPVDCGCKMIWMIDWLQSNQNIVQDYRDITCHDSKFYGKPVYRLDKVAMGCYPTLLPVWVIPVLVLAGLIILCTVITGLLIGRYWNQTKLWLYLNFNILNKNDGDEDLAGIKYDALLSFR